jgi:very-short-patch-repair endonuclease
VRRRDLAQHDRACVRDLWLTDAPLAVLEAAVELGAEGSTLLDRALQRRVSFAAMYRAHCRNLGRIGSAAASVLLSAAADRAASQAERLLVKLLRAAGIIGWEPGHPWGGYVIDVAFPGVRIAIEVDGWAWHMTPERFVRDRQRQNAVVNGQWHVLRFTWHDLTGRPAAVITEIRDALASR